MPATKLVCPHCEKTVEVQVSSVTRSRPCPECGEMVMLQMAEKSTKTKRRALLMSQAEPSAPAVAADPEPLAKVSHEPQPLPGDAFERMRKDPEVGEFKRKFIFGASAAAAVVLILIVVSVAQSYREDKTGGDQNPPVVPASKEETAPQPAMVTPEDLPAPVTSGNLVFRPAGGGLTTAEPAPRSRSESLAKLAAGEDILRQFLQAPNWQQRALTVRNQLRVAPLMSTYYSKNSDGPILFDSLVEAEEVPPRFTEHVVVFEGGGRRTATVEHTPSGPRVDWESFVGCGDMAWSDFLQAKPTSPVLFRVLVSPAGHYENSFADPSQLKCYSLRSIAEPGAKVVYGYLDRHSPQARELDYWLELNNEEAVPMILRLKFPADASADFQVWIHQFVQAGWVKR